MPGALALISMPEIAELAGVQRPVVTVWRRRHRDSFPRPVAGDAGRPLFDAQAVIDWLADTGRIDRDTVGPDLRQHTLWHLSHRMNPAELITSGTALICLRGLDDDEPLHSDDGWARALAARARRIDPDDMFLRSEIEALPPDAAWLVAAMDELVEAAWGCRSAFERMLHARTRLNVAALCRDAIRTELAALIAAVSGATEYAADAGTVVIADPWAGTGDLLSAIVSAVGEHGQPAVWASAPTGPGARLLRRRLRMWDLPRADIDVHIGTALPAGTSWDVLATSLPYRPSENRSREGQLDYLRQVATSLTRHQSAAILGPADLLADQMSPTEARIRDDILRTDTVEAAIKLPAGLMPFRPGYQTALWVLRHDGSGRGHGRTLLADISDRSLTATVVHELAGDVTTWRREGYHPAAHRRAFATPVRVADLVGEHGSMTRRREPDAPEAGALQHSRVALLLDLRTRLDQQEQQLPRAPVRSTVSVREAEARPTVTIGALIGTRAISRQKGARIAAAHVTRDGHHPVIGAQELSGNTRTGQRTVDRFTLAEHYPRVRLTEPGDVIVTMAPSLSVYVDRDGFSIVEYPAAVLRVSGGTRTLTARILAAMITSAAAARPVGAPRARRLDQLHVPVLQPDEVSALDDLLADLDERRRRASTEIDLLDTLRQTTIAGLADGTLTIAPDRL